jgi:hypothetical protein
VSELVVYYLWLILPFREALERLARGYRGPISPFLWPAVGGGDKGGSWPSERLRKVLQQEAEAHL